MPPKQKIDTNPEGLAYIFAHYLAGFVSDAKLKITDEKRCQKIVEKWAKHLAKFTQKIKEDKGYGGESYEKEIK